MTPNQIGRLVRKGIIPESVSVPPDQALVEYINQNGIRPGPIKLTQFRAALKFRGTPPLMAQERFGMGAKVHVKLFDPCGSATWYLTEWDGEDEAFCYVTGLTSDEWGTLWLPEIAQTPGRFGIGIEIDVWFLPTTIRLALENK
jgi:hypothetical protein